jgi:hypothetical protein
LQELHSTKTRNVTVTEQQRTKESFKYTCEISKPFGHLDHVIDWCKSELAHDWRWQLVSVSTDQRPGVYVFYFDNEQDVLAFNLKWL